MLHRNNLPTAVPHPQKGQCGALIASGLVKTLANPATSRRKAVGIISAIFLKPEFQLPISS
jgi:hypothetical protein